MFKNPRRGRQAKNFTANVPKISSRSQIAFPTDFPKLDVGCPGLIPVQSFSACIFSRIYALIVSDTNFHQFGYIFSFYTPYMSQARSQNKTAAKQNDIHSNKRPRVFADEPPSANETFFGALSQGLCADWLKSALPIVFSGI